MIPGRLSIRYALLPCCVTIADTDMSEVHAVRVVRLSLSSAHYCSVLRGLCVTIAVAVSPGIRIHFLVLVCDYR